jgi:hypothetical protein
MMFHSSDWVVQRYILREHGVVLAGPPLSTLIDPVSPDDLRRAVVELVRGWYALMLDDPEHIERLRFGGYQEYTVLTMCRILYTLEVGDVVTKPAAARWALQGPGKPWASLIQEAIDWRNGDPFDHLDETQDLIRYVVERCEQFETAQT